LRQLGNNIRRACRGTLRTIKGGPAGPLVLA
jgi:hypothetical protein